MKKEYDAPKAEKMEFNYSETVVASATACDWFKTITQQEQGCSEVTTNEWHPNINTL